MGGQGHLPRGVKGGKQGYFQIGLRQHGSCIFGPFGEFEAGAGKKVSETRVFPLAWVGKAVKVKMPHVQARQFVGLHHGVGGAFDAAALTQCVQQMAHQRGLAGTQIAMECNEGMPDGRLRRQSRGKRLRGLLVGPEQCFYNRGVTINSIQFDSNQLVSQMQAWARELGFSQIGVTGVDLSSAEAGLMAWLSRGFHGDMAYMESHGLKRARPAELVPGTVCVITARMDYLPQTTPEGWQTVELERLQRPGEGIVSVYARGRDYHKVLRSRLQKLSDRIATAIGPFGHRVFTDSAPVLEAELAARSGQGWRGKHTLLLNREAGSMFFLGEIYVDVALPASEPVQEHCGTCNACITVCPTQAIVAPYRLDARRCISYLTIEHAGPIALELRPLLGNRIYGCDDCQLVCPWNKFAQRSPLPDFDPREGLSGQQLVQLFGWTEAEFLQRTEGSPIRRIGHERWLRNIAVALGNERRALRAPPALRAGQVAIDEAIDAVKAALLRRSEHPSALVREHVAWALQQ